MLRAQRFLRGWSLQVCNARWRALQRVQVELVHRAHTRTVVTTGLDPVVHPLRINFLRRSWIAGSLGRSRQSSTGYARQ
jgi:hypothetical protein